LMEQLGILVDVSHLSAAGTDHVLALATRPVVASHSSAHALRAHHRNLTDERIKGIAASGGVVGVNFCAGFIDPDDASVERLVDHVEHVASIAGTDHVGLGPDFVTEVFAELLPLCDHIISQGIDAKQTIPGLEGPAGLPLVTAEMVRRGWSEPDIRLVLGGSWLRLFARELGVARAASSGSGSRR
ncbi:MAG: dipeptidase, partial [Acidimicrobiales bacterium]